GLYRVPPLVFPFPPSPRKATAHGRYSPAKCNREREVLSAGVSRTPKEEQLMRRELLVAIALAVFGSGAATAVAQEKAAIELRSGLVSPALPLQESEKGVYGVRLTAQIDRKGEGNGSLELDPKAPTFDECGYVTTGGGVAPVKLDCTLKFVKKGKVRVNADGRPGGPLKEVEWLLFEIQGPKITSRLYLATRAENLVAGP